MDNLPSSGRLSLLWPPDISADEFTHSAARRWGTYAAADLNLDALAGALSSDCKHTAGTRTILMTLCEEPRVIRYRQAVIDDLLRCPALVTGLVAGIAPADTAPRVPAAGGAEAFRRTYRILPGPPMGLSYARDIAAQYGISFEQPTQTLRARGIVTDHC